MGYVNTSTKCSYFKELSIRALTKLEAFNSKTGWRKVSFMSRPVVGIEGARLDAWYLESPKGTKNSPTIVVQHGNNVNNNDHTVMVVGTMLRELNYNILLPSLRNHGTSAKTEAGVITWAASEVYDLLAAWDYAVTDPDGKLGGRKKPSEVAMLGFSMGGYVAQVAFGLEPRCPGLLLDGAVFDAYAELEFKVTKEVGSVGATFLMPSAWFWVHRLAGHDLDDLTPETALQRSGDKRKIATVHGFDDVTVPYAQEEARLKFLKATDYELVESWHLRHIPEALAEKHTEECTPHCEIHLTNSLEYMAFACRFYAKVFNQDGERCASVSIVASPPAAHQKHEEKNETQHEAEKRLLL